MGKVISKSLARLGGRLPPRHLGSITICPPRVNGLAASMGKLSIIAPSASTHIKTSSRRFLPSYKPSKGWKTDAAILRIKKRFPQIKKLPQTMQYLLTKALATYETRAALSGLPIGPNLPMREIVTQWEDLKGGFRNLLIVLDHHTTKFLEEISELPFEYQRWVLTIMGKSKTKELREAKENNVWIRRYLSSFFEWTGSFKKPIKRFGLWRRAVANQQTIYDFEDSFRPTVEGSIKVHLPERVKSESGFKDIHIERAALEKAHAWAKQVAIPLGLESVGSFGGFFTKGSGTLILTTFTPMPNTTVDATLVLLYGHKGEMRPHCIRFEVREFLKKYEPNIWDFTAEQIAGVIAKHKDEIIATSGYAGYVKGSLSGKDSHRIHIVDYVLSMIDAEINEHRKQPSKPLKAKPLKEPLQGSATNALLASMLGGKANSPTIKPFSINWHSHPRKTPAGVDGNRGSYEDYSVGRLRLITTPDAGHLIIGRMGEQLSVDDYYELPFEELVNRGMVVQIPHSDVYERDQVLTSDGPN